MRRHVELEQSESAKRTSDGAGQSQTRRTREGPGKVANSARVVSGITLNTAHAAFDSLPRSALNCVVKLLQTSWDRRTFVNYFPWILGCRAMRKRQVHSSQKSTSSCTRGFQFGCRMVGMLSVSQRIPSLRCGEHSATMWLRRRHSGDDGLTLSSSSLDAERSGEA